ncbi:MAG: type II toxin-antitoxin system Phd/YefM family antitoxin [Acidobacteria bacterium]|nr:type II toxin-antitoxin system Phd/YefM family antitoxin [Acidobacteriota bacterium]
MIDLNDIHSLSEFQRNAKSYIGRMKKTGRPVVLTINGKAELVVHDAASYQKMLDLVEQAETIAAIQIGLEQVEQGRVKPAEKIFKGLRKKYNMAAKK